MTRIVFAALLALSATHASASLTPIPFPILTFPPEETEPVTKGCSNITTSQITCQ